MAELKIVLDVIKMVIFLNISKLIIHHIKFRFRYRLVREMWIYVPLTVVLVIQTCGATAVEAVDDTVQNGVSSKKIVHC